MTEPSTIRVDAEPEPEARAGPSPARLGRSGRGLTHGLVEALSQKLRSSTVKPGERLPSETVIMQTYGVSRGVVREALSRLQAAGLVQTHHGVGTFALAPSAEGLFRFDGPPRGGIADMLDLLELRTSVESDAAGLAALRRHDDHLEEMRSALADFERHLPTAGETVAPDLRFHLAIAQATGNRCFIDLMKHLGLEVIPQTRVSSAWLTVEHRSQHLHKVNQEHQDIHAAIERRDPEAARAAMRLHLVNSRERQRRAHARPE